MKSAFVALTIAGLAAAQGSIPSCAQPCVNAITSGGSIGGCAALDIACVCENGSLLDSIACCLEEECDEAGKEAAVKYAAQICGSAGVRDIPTEVVCKSDASSTKTDSSSSRTTGAAQGTPGAETTTGTATEAEQTTGTATGGSANSTQTDDGDAAAGLSAPMGMVGAVLLGWLAL